MKENDFQKNIFTRKDPSYHKCSEFNIKAFKKLEFKQKLHEQLKNFEYLMSQLLHDEINLNNFVIIPPNNC